MTAPTAVPAAAGRGFRLPRRFLPSLPVPTPAQPATRAIRVLRSPR
jgi:hypothetical protein